MFQDWASWLSVVSLSIIAIYIYVIDRPQRSEMFHREVIVLQGIRKKPLFRV
jgi:hypothetical protein